MSEKSLRLFVTVSGRRFVVHLREQELHESSIDTVGKLAVFIQKNPRYAGLCGENRTVPSVIMNDGGFEVLPSEPLSVIRDNDEITFVAPHIQHTVLFD